MTASNAERNSKGAWLVACEFLAIPVAEAATFILGVVLVRKYRL